MSGIDEPSTSSGRPARNMPKIDYKKFSEGNFAEVAFSDTQSDENAASQYEDADDVLPLSDPDEEIERIRLICRSHNALRRQDFRLKWQLQIRQNYQ